MRIATLFGLCLLVAGGLFCGLAINHAVIQISALQRSSLAIDVVDSYREALVVGELLALERGPMTSALAESAPVTGEDLERMRRRGRAVDEAIEAVRRGLRERRLPEATQILGAIARVEHADRIVREAVAAHLATGIENRHADGVWNLTQAMFGVHHDLGAVLAVLERLAGGADATTTHLLMIVRYSSDIREAAGRLSASMTAAHVARRPFTASEVMLLDRLRGRFEYLRSRIDSAIRTRDDQSEVAYAWGRATQGFMRQGMAWIDQLIAVGRTDGNYPITKEEQVERIQPSLQTLLALRDAALADARNAAVAAHEAAVYRLIGEAGAVTVALLTLVLITVLLRTRIIRPLTTVAATIAELADGRRDIDVPFQTRFDEIGDIARALSVLRKHAIEADRMTERTRRWDRENYEQAMRAREEAAIASRNKSWFLASMSHELRTPLNAIIGFAEIMYKEMFGTMSDRYRAYAADILHSGLHLLTLVNRVLDLSKIEAGMFKPAQSPVSVPDALDHCLMLLQLDARSQGVDVQVRIDRAMPQIRSDATALRQILTNLLANAVKFTDSGGHVDVTAQRDAEGAIVISIVDTGVGMSEEELGLALMPFGRPDTPLTRRREGTGLGLPLAKQLTEAVGAVFSITSRPLVGTAVTITFPPETILTDPNTPKSPVL